MVTSEEFFALVDRHLTPAMLAAGHSRIGEYDDHAGHPPQVLESLDPGRPGFLGWRRRRRRQPTVHVLEVGYELSTSDEESWITYYPDAGELDLIAWREELDGHADWDLWQDLVPDVTELERRLVVLRDAIRGQLRSD